MKMVLLIRFWNSKCSYEAESSVFDANIYYFNMHGSILLVSIKEVSLPWWHYSQHQHNNDFISFIIILEISNMATECGLGRSVNPKWARISAAEATQELICPPFQILFHLDTPRSWPMDCDFEIYLLSTSCTGIIPQKFDHDCLLTWRDIGYGGVEGPPHIFFRHHAISYGWHSNSSVGDSNYCYVIRRTY